MPTELDPFDLPQTLETVRQMLPAPIHEEKLLGDVTRMIGGDPAEVVVDIDSQNIRVSEYAVVIESNPTPILEPNHLGSLFWNKLPGWTTRRILQELTAAAASARRAKYQDCIRCQKEFPPEKMAGNSVCKSCARSEEGVVY